MSAVVFLWHLFVLFWGCTGDDTEFELPPLDGWYNNLLHPDWGAVETQLLRKSKTAYGDGVYSPSGGDRPNPFLISRTVHQGHAGLPSYRGRTAMLVYFGQQIVEEIVDSQRPGCPIEYFNVPVPKGHRSFDPSGKGDVEMTFKRSRYDQRTGYSPNNPRQQLNEITPFLDGQVIYGPNKAWTDAIRAFEGGRLAGRNPGDVRQDFPINNTIRLPYANPPVARDHELKPVTRFYTLGNPRGHENPMLLAFGIIWFRWHNAEAERVRRQHPEWDPVKDDEKIFNLARKRVTAAYQKIIFYDWLPHWLGVNERHDIDDFTQRFFYTRDTYDPNIHPGITHEFQSAAMRFGHTLVTPGLWRSRGNCNFRRSSNPKTFQQTAALRLCNNFWNSREAVEEDLDALVRGMAITIAEREDPILVPDLTDSLFGPLEFSRRDLAALNIQRGRDHGLPDYNSVREAYGLRRRTSWEGIGRWRYNLEAIRKLKALYGDPDKPDNVDLFTGGMLETTPNGPGELFQKIILDQFIRIRNGDRFWFENNATHGWSDDEYERIWGLNLKRIIDRVTNVGFDEIQNNVFLYTEEDKRSCRDQPKQLDPNETYKGFPILEECTPLEHYDYFSGSEVAFAMTYLLAALCIPVTFLIMYMMAQRRIRSVYRTRVTPVPLQRTPSSNPNEFRVLEWVDEDTVERTISVVLDQADQRINVLNVKNVLLRFIDVRLNAGHNNNFLEVHISSDKTEDLLSIKLPGEYDLVIRFHNTEERGKFKILLDQFLGSAKIRTTTRSLVESYILRTTTTRRDRQQKLDRFFRRVFLQIFQGSNADEFTGSDTSIPEDITHVELTQTEFAEAFGMKPNSTFVKHMFLLVDSNNSGHVSFREFLDIFILLSSDNVDNKIRLLFNMYDIQRRGVLTKDDLYKMVRSLLDLSESQVTEEKVEEYTETLYKSAGLRRNAEMTYRDFRRVFASEEHVKTLKKATLELESQNADEDQATTLKPAVSSRLMQRRTTLVKGYSMSNLTSMQTPFSRPRIQSTCSTSSSGGGRGYNTFMRHASRVDVSTDFQRAPSGLREKWANIVRFLETFRLQVFWMSLYIFITLGIFLERSFFYGLEREHGGLRRVAGHGISITRGAASVISFTSSSLLLTMCRNVITILRETFLHRFIPFDSLHSMHKFIACLTLFFTGIHIFCHALNFYHVTTQPSTDLNCYFREYFRASHELASFQYWAFGTITGFTGVFLTVLMMVLYVFATPYSRRHLFHAFWNTHKLYIPIYILLFLHGSARLVQTPHFPFYFIGPAILFSIDSLISISRSKFEMAVLKADILPSGVTALKVKKPPGFEYKSGQWVRVACIALGEREFHPFTLTSAPHEKYLTLHIRAVGPWTTNLRRVYDPNTHRGLRLPALSLDGPFGEGHQDWYRFEVSVLIGGGIGVTPFASILKDIVYKSSMEVSMQCQKVYFLWVTRTQKQFEWVTDIIRDVETKDVSNLVTVHIFVTEFKSKFDLRTTMLYICERHFQKVAGKSLFTGLEAITHFGRPRFLHFLESLRYEHKDVQRLGVFSCGPPPMTLAVERACAELNKFKRPTYFHHYENF